MVCPPVFGGNLESYWHAIFLQETGRPTTPNGSVRRLAAGYLTHGEFTCVLLSMLPVKAVNQGTPRGQGLGLFFRDKLTVSRFQVPSSKPTPHFPSSLAFGTFESMIFSTFGGICDRFLEGIYHPNRKVVFHHFSGAMFQHTPPSTG